VCALPQLSPRSRSQRWHCSPLAHSPGMEAVISVYVLVPALSFLLYVLLEVVHTKLRPLPRLSVLFPPAEARRSTAAKQAASATAAYAASPEAPQVEGQAETDDDGIEMQRAHGVPPQA
jgi:hypothetical protein